MSDLNATLLAGAILRHGTPKITIRSTTVTKLHVGWDYKPGGITAAQMDLPYSLAVMAMEGDAFVDQFTEEKVKDPTILDFIKRIAVVPDPELDRLGQDYRHAIICQVETKDGRSLERRVDFAKGGTSKPMPRQEVEGNFRTLAAKVLPERKVQDLYETILNMENIPSLTDFTRLLVP